jgi:hypothetical protein
MSSISSFWKLFECSGLAESVMWFMISYKFRQTHLSWLRDNDKMTFFQYKSSSLLVGFIYRQKHVYFDCYWSPFKTVFQYRQPTDGITYIYEEELIRQKSRQTDDLLCYVT